MTTAITDILDAAGADYRPSLSSKNEITVCCPFCAERGEGVDTRFRLGINVVKGAGSCFNCHWKGRTIAYIATQLGRVYGIRFKARKALAVKKAATTPEPVRAYCLPLEYEPLNGELDTIGKEAKAYLTKRKVSTLQIVKHKIGFAAAGDFSWRILFPVFEGYDITGCVGRALRDDMTPKYLNSTGIKSLWNAQAPMGTAIVVEGVMDALRVETALLQVRNMTAVARLGSTITTGQLDQLKAFEKVVVLPDWDKAGVQGAIELCTRCEQRGIRISVAVPKRMSGIDPGDMLESQILDEINDSVLWNDSTTFRLRASMLRRD